MTTYKCTKCGAIFLGGEVLTVQTIRARRFGPPADCNPAEHEDRCPECGAVGTLADEEDGGYVCVRCGTTIILPADEHPGWERLAADLERAR